VDKKSAACAALFSQLFCLEILQDISQGQYHESNNQKNYAKGEGDQTSQEWHKLEEDSEDKHDNSN